MKFAKYVFLIAGIYGILVVAPMYFTETQVGILYPPAINHPEYYYGFIGVTLAWQVLFLLISRDPQRYRIMMLPAVLEKVSYVAAVFWLFAEQRIELMVLSTALVDLLIGILFLISFIKTKGQANEPLPEL